MPPSRMALAQMYSASSADGRHSFSATSCGEKADRGREGGRAATKRGDAVRRLWSGAGACAKKLQQSKGSCRICQAMSWEDPPCNISSKHWNIGPNSTACLPFM